MFQSGLHDQRFYEQMWDRLTSGQPWHGVLVNRRKDGELYEEDATIAPVLDADGELIAYVAAKHDLSTERRLEADLVREQRSRDELVDLMRRVRTGDTLEQSADDLCREVVRLDFVDEAMVLLLREDGSLVPIASGDRDLRSASGAPLGLVLGEPLPIDDAERFLGRLSAGTWWIDLTSPPALPDGELIAEVADLGLTAAAFARIAWEGTPIGVLVIASTAPDAPGWMALRMPALEELGSFGTHGSRGTDGGRRGPGAWRDHGRRPRRRRARITAPARPALRSPRPRGGRQPGRPGALGARRGLVARPAVGRPRLGRRPAGPLDHRRAGHRLDR